MTEKEAWLYLGRLWEGACRQCNDGPTHIEIGLLNGVVVWCVGLCSSIKTLEISGEITMRIRYTMIRKVSRIPRLPLSVYCWPRTKSGAAERATFCRKMARECE